MCAGNTVDALRLPAMNAPESAAYPDSSRVTKGDFLITKGDFLNCFGKDRTSGTSVALCDDNGYSPGPQAAPMEVVVEGAVD